MLEQEGAVYKATGGKVSSIDWKYDFNSLWKLDPLSQAENDLKNSQRDELDFNIGKATSEELRELDDRYSDLEDFEVNEEIEKIANEE